MSSTDPDTHRAKELERLADQQATRSLLEESPSLLAWLPAARIPSPDTPATRARAVHDLFREIMERAQSAYSANAGDSVARDTLAVGALFGLVTWGPTGRPDPGGRPAASKEVRRGLAGSWLEPPVLADTIRRRVHKQRLLTEFLHTLYDYDAPAPPPQGDITPAPVIPAPPVRRGRARRRFVLTALAAVVTATAVLLAVTRPWSDPPRKIADSARIKDRAVGVEGKESVGSPVKVISVNSLNTGSNSWAFPDVRELSAAELREIGDIGNQTRYDDWFLERDAVPVGLRADQVLLEGNSDRSVRIVGLTLDKTCREPLAGTLFDNPDAGQDDTVMLRVDLDQRFPVVQSSDPDAEEGDYFEHNSISLKQGEQVTVIVLAYTQRQYCEYNLDFEIAHGDETLTQTVKDNGRPFRLSADTSDTGRTHPYDSYGRVYLGGVAVAAVCPSGGGEFIGVDPKTFTYDTRQCS